MFSLSLELLHTCWLLILCISFPISCARGLQAAKAVLLFDFAARLFFYSRTAPSRLPLFNCATMAHTTATRLFFVRCGDASPSDGVAPPFAAEATSFVELPRLPVAHPDSAENSGSGSGGDGLDTLPRPLVSPALHLGRQTPFLSAALHNDRAWSRALLEVTTWCIHGLAASATVTAVDAASLPYAGVRVRLCGRGQPLRVLPSNLHSGQRRGPVVLAARGSHAWLQHGDVIEFGTAARVRLLAVHVRVSAAVDLASAASFVWVPTAALPTRRATPAITTALASSSGTQTPTVPTALWCARLADWSATPRFLKAKMLSEAAQLAWYACAAGADEHRRNAAPASRANAKGSTEARSREASSAENGQRSREEGLFFEAPARRVDSEGRHSDSAAAEDVHIDAATPTADSQQLHGRSGRSPAHVSGEWSLPRHGLASAASLPDVSNGSGPLTRSPARPRRSSSAQAEAAMHFPPAPTGHAPSTGPPPQRPSTASARYSLANLSETVDDRLIEALVHLENGGHVVGDALVQRRDQALLLGALEEDLSGTRAVSADADEAMRGSVSQRRRGGDEGEGEEDDGDAPSTTPAPRRRGGKRGRESGGRGGRALRGGREKPRRNPPPAPREASHTDSARSDGDRPVAVPLTRADIRRLHSDAAAPQEDSQVVFFDH